MDFKAYPRCNNLQLGNTVFPFPELHVCTGSLLLKDEDPLRPICGQPQDGYEEERHLNDGDQFYVKELVRGKKAKELLAKWFYKPIN